MLKNKFNSSYRHFSYFFGFIVLLFLCVYYLENQAMFGFFKRYDVELSPEVKGRVTDKGKILSGTEVMRKLYYEGYDKSPVTDYALTNNHGEFSFDQLIIKSKAPGNIFGQDYLIRQEITIKNNSKDNTNNDGYYWLWVMSKGWRSVPPVNDLLLNLNADLQNEEIQYDLDISHYGGSRYQPLITICNLDENTINNLLSPD
ncbi:DUF6795 domain-containing protein [Pseudoalteromonas carrageenovora]|uniref:DUF6795 domain-containing protein n=1 Tax=Pseudoalteromonas carrageenovora TaxID=227 RepID=UPI0026E33A4C|nr:DUF6795 domain-containing protein [Pseudoalteromonas carrageenovora]MDO6466097.1 hypothetical protein [Pseudoalteromonas carrageenovora]